MYGIPAGIRSLRASVSWVAVVAVAAKVHLDRRDRGAKRTRDHTAGPTARRVSPLTAAGRSPQASKGMAIEEGKAAPAFTLRDAEGRDVALSSFAGKNVILYFYPKDDTPGCTKEACGFRDGWSELKEAGAVV